MQENSLLNNFLIQLVLGKLCVGVMCLRVSVHDGFHQVKVFVFSLPSLSLPYISVSLCLLSISGCLLQYNTYTLPLFFLPPFIWSGPNGFNNVPFWRDMYPICQDLNLCANGSLQQPFFCKKKINCIQCMYEKIINHSH